MAMRAVGQSRRKPYSCGQTDLKLPLVLFNKFNGRHARVFKVKVFFISCLMATVVHISYFSLIFLPYLWFDNPKALHFLRQLRKWSDSRELSREMCQVQTFLPRRGFPSFFSVKGKDNLINRTGRRTGDGDSFSPVENTSVIYSFTRAYLRPPSS